MVYLWTQCCGSYAILKRRCYQMQRPRLCRGNAEAPTLPGPPPPLHVMRWGTHPVEGYSSPSSTSSGSAHGAAPEEVDDGEQDDRAEQGDQQT
jgi:hypothetical protein